MNRPGDGKHAHRTQGGGEAPPSLSPIRDIELEFLRAGPAHNQLLSPLTPYIALCGADGPVNLHLPFEHSQLLTRLNRLNEANGGVLSAELRDAELRELGEVIGGLLALIPALVSSLRSARAEVGQLVNIRLRISAFELGLVPFEATMVPADGEGSAAPLLLRTSTGMTREIRRGEPLPLDWDRPPKILFAFASPRELAEVPAQDHVDALRRAIDPWIGIKDDSAERLVDVRRMLTVLKDASLSAISAACRADDYTHVHILAHGAPIPGAENRRFGICLVADDEPDSRGLGYVVVDGQRLAAALVPASSDGRRKPAPTVVTLSTCDSGHIGNVLTPGGSIAHELHAADVPWVIASQFPLSMRASTLCTEWLYRGLLEGHDPRRVLQEVRQRLRLDLPTTHDWASLVAYAAIGPDLPSQVDAFRGRQTKRRLDLEFERMDALVGVAAFGWNGDTDGSHDRGSAGDGDNHSGGDTDLDRATGTDETRPRPIDSTAVAAELTQLCSTVRAGLAAWCDQPVARHDARQRAARLAMRAASEKRIAIVYGFWAARRNAERPGDERVAAGSPRLDPAGGSAAAARRHSDEAYRQARHFYRAALRAEPANHWAITQFLSLTAIPALAADEAALAAAAADHGRWWQTARQLAEWDANGSSGRALAWAHGTLAELELLGAVYASGEQSPEARRAAVVAECRRLDDASVDDRFPVESTLRQFRRYLDHWPRPEWLALAQAAVAALSGVAGNG